MGFSVKIDWNYESAVFFRRIDQPPAQWDTGIVFSVLRPALVSVLVLDGLAHAGDEDEGDRALAGVIGTGDNRIVICPWRRLSFQLDHPASTGPRIPGGVGGHRE